ncbi:MAG: hypothetical protein KA020_02940 [Planctomycetes bacterium]|nr:hypothetical protein [Planctomycetota bacterium]
MTALTRWLSRLQFSPRSQRVLTEATLDWQHEVATAPTHGIALWRHCRSAVGWGRAAAAVIVSETGASLSVSWTVRWLLATAVLCWAQMGGRLPELLGTPHAVERYQLLIIQTVIGNLPFGVALAILLGPRHVASPVVGLQVAGLLASMVLAWLIVPIVWRGYVEVAIGRSLPSRYGPQYPLGRLLWQAFFALLFSLIADRSRISSRRMHDLALALTLGVLALGGLRAATSILSRPLGPALAVVAVPLSLIGIWLALVVTQERREAQHVA